MVWECQRKGVSDSTEVERCTQENGLKWKGERPGEPTGKPTFKGASKEKPRNEMEVERVWLLFKI